MSDLPASARVTVVSVCFNSMAVLPDMLASVPADTPASCAWDKRHRAGIAGPATAAILRGWGPRHLSSRASAVPAPREASAIR